VNGERCAWRTILLLAALLVASCAGLPSATPSPLPATPAPPTPVVDRCNFARLPANALSPLSGPRVYVDHTYEQTDAGLWRFSTPEEQGLDSEILDEGIAYLAKNKGVYSLIIARNGVIVVEKYFHAGRINHAANTQSVTKSILSALVGIAIREGYIESVDQKVSEFLPEYFTDVDDPRKQELTLRHLLTMRAGFDWPDNLVSGLSGEDWAQAALARPLASPPGRTFAYNSVSSHIISIVLTRATGMSTCEFAYRYLFDPLGITVENWFLDPQGHALGGTGLFITPREMLKFGLLYLNRGEWAGVQVVPAEWVTESQGTRVVVSGPANVRYGYFWWQHGAGGHRVNSALGYGGQNINIVPDMNLVMVTTADSWGIPDGIDAFYFLEHYVMPAANFR